MPIAAVFLVFVFFLSGAEASEPPPAPHLIAHWGRQGTEPGLFGAVMAIAIAPDGSVYAADSNGRIEKFSADGDFLLEWGSRGSQDGQFVTPTGIAVGPTGEVYVVEYRGNRVQVFDGNGRFRRKWGSQGSGPGQFNGPEKIAVDRSGDVYVTDTDNFRVEKFSSSGQFQTSWGSRGNAPGEFGRPIGIAVSTDGRVYVADMAVGSIQVFSSDGRFLARWGAAKGKVPEPRRIPSGKGVLMAGRGEFGGAVLSDTVHESSLDKPGGIAVDSAGTLYVLNRTGGRVDRYAAGGEHLDGWEVTDLSIFGADQATEIAVATGGDVYVAALNGPRIQKFGYGPLRSERVVPEFLGPDRLRTLDSLIAMPLGERKSSSTVVAAQDIRVEWGFLGFNPEPTLQSATLEVDVPDSPKGESVRAALVDAVGRRLGFPAAPVDQPLSALDSATHENAGVFIRSQASRQGAGGYRIRIERESTNERMATTNADACDLRLLEGGLTEPKGQWEALLRGLRVRSPDLAAALVSGRVTRESLLQEVQSASGAAVPEADRDLMLLVADQWLRFSTTTGERVHPVRRLDDPWITLGFRNSQEPQGSGDYCGSMLESLATGVGRNEWADRAFLLFLDEGSVTHCYADDYGQDYGQNLYLPVLKHGEAFLAANDGAALWPSVALRVALAHETAWSHSKRDWGDDPDLKAQAPEHRRRALELYRKLSPRTQDPRLRRAMERRVRDLERGAASKCAVYWIVGNC